MRSTERGIRFAVWNAHSVNNKRADIEYLLHDRELDILCITETWLDVDVAFEFFGYLTYRSLFPWMDLGAIDWMWWPSGCLQLWAPWRPC